MVSTSLMVDTIPVPSRRNILCAVNCALTTDAANSAVRDLVQEVFKEFLPDVARRFG